MRFRLLSLLQLLMFYAHHQSTHAQSIIDDSIGSELPDTPLIDKGKEDLMSLCESFPAYEGWFRFLENRAEAYFLAQDGFLYFEYYFPQFMFTAIAVSNQTNNGGNTGCLTCYDLDDPDRDVQACLSECCGGNEFVITGMSDPTQNIIESWKQWEVDFVDSGDVTDPEQFLLYRYRGIGTLREPAFLESATINGLPYIHGYWSRYWNNSDDDTWQKPLTDKEPFCITTVSSAPGNPYQVSVGEGPFMAGIHSHALKELTEVHCVNVSQKCTHYTVDPTRSPSSEPTMNPTPRPTTPPTREIYPPTDVEVPSDVCAWANMTFIVLVDASESIAGTHWEISKEWIVKIFDDADLTIKRQEAEWREQGYDITLCMRTALLLFSSSVSTVWDLQAYGECYNVTSGKKVILNLERPHNPYDTISGTHTKDALQVALDLTRAQRRDDERTMVLLLTDGLPQAIQGDESQNPCFLSPNPLAYGYSPNDQNIDLAIVGVGENQGNLGSLPSSFACFTSKTYITVGDIIDVPEYTTEVNNEFFAAFCRVKTYGCDIPLYPHQSQSTQALYNTSLVNFTMDGTVTSFLVTFETFAQYASDDDTSVFIWPHQVSIKAESFCQDDNITLSAKLWLWTDDDTLDPNPIVSKNKAYVRYFEKDLDTDHYNWYNLSFPTETESYLFRARFYTLEIVIEDYGDCHYSDLRFLAQAPELNTGIVYETEKFENVFMVLKDNDDDVAWYPDVLSSTSLPDDADEVWPFITFCINEWAVPPTASPTDSPTAAPTDIPTETPTMDPSKSPTPAPTNVPTGIPTAAPTMEFCSEKVYPSPLDIVFIVDTTCGLNAQQCAQQQEYVSDLVQAVKNTLNRVSYIECSGDTLSSQVVVALDDVKFNDVPDNAPNTKTLTQLFNTVRDSRTCQVNAAIHKVEVPYKLHCLNLAIAQFDLDDYTRFKKVAYVSNCEEEEDVFEEESICSRDDLTDIGGRIDLIAVNVGVNEFNIDRDELECITSSDRIFSYPQLDELADDARQFDDVKEEICEPPTAVPTLSPTALPSSSPTREPTDQPTSVPSDQPTVVPTTTPTKEPTTAEPTLSPTPAPSHSPNYQTVCDWPESTDVVFVVDETCDLSARDIQHQNEFMANLIQRIKMDALTPRLGYIGCSPSADVVFDVTSSIYNDAFYQLDEDDIKAMSLEIRDRTFDSSRGRPHRKDCILAAMNSFGEDNTRNKKIVVLSNCEETAASDTCSLRDNEIADYGDHIDFILVNVGEAPLELNTCLEESPDRLFYYASSEMLSPFQGQSEVLTHEICSDPTPSPTAAPTELPSSDPTAAPTASPTDRPTKPPTTPKPTRPPSPAPTGVPTKDPTVSPTSEPSVSPSYEPTASPTHSPHQYPTRSPSRAPTSSPTASPLTPTHRPTAAPTPLECPAPPDFLPPDSEAAIACEPSETEWGISFTNWAYDAKYDVTYVRYEVCVSRAVPFEACGNATDPTCLAGMFIQIPCLCEVCLPEVTYHMEPAGKASIAFEGWLWFEQVSAGECQNFDVVIRGHAQMHEGVYKLFGMDGRYEVGMIQTPNPCYFNADNPFDDDDDKNKNKTDTDTDTDDTDSDVMPNKCGSRSMEFAEKTCDFLCDYNASEFSGEFVSRLYNEDRDETVFTYQISTDSVDNGCHPNEEPVTADFFFVRVGCDCEPMSSTFLTSITKDMQPYGTVGDVYWLWHDIQVRPGQSLLVNLTLVGDIPYSVGDLTFAGDSPNGYSFCSNDWHHEGVPDPCDDRCLYGQWTEW
eukprot:CAMPEP_0202695886 /NCGR_PEP_ID=MMETSP1385-20130828/9334_1 /ASSEMBLY_ACC=CAM_ASM_000861 /TAXON_ID=933848 /ORGANISM="Elphidium margaritaceum" /LENGTH=1763 /DNA_ID=CAMNT_0049351965 /DNA_START=212 /DNA_END=5500 /DNA_ORIENTATION=+